jgi:hypothetical protein
MPVFHPLETVRRTVPLGLLCVDIATQAQVSSGLSVTALPTGRTARPARAALTRSGIYAFHGLPGLLDFEFASAEVAAESPPAASPPSGREFAVFVEDTEGRYLPYVILLTLPRARALKTPLFPGPGRDAAAGLMVIRGGLRDGTRTLPDGRHPPAPFARVVAQYELTSPPTIYVALADWRGEFALFLPAPNPLRLPSGSPVTSPNTRGRSTISQSRWPVTLQFFYGPRRQQFVTADGRGRVTLIDGPREGLTDVRPESSPAPYFPLLPSLLGQPAAQVIPVAGGAGAASLRAEIAFGKDLAVRTEGGGDSSVWLLPPPAVSP